MEYVIINYSMGEIEMIRVVTEKEMFDALDKAKGDGLEVAVFKLGECVIDWS